MKKIILGISLLLCKGMITSSSLPHDNNQAINFSKFEELHDKIVDNHLKKLTSSGRCRNGDFTQYNFYNVIPTTDGKNVTVSSYYTNERFDKVILKLNRRQWKPDLLGSVLSGMNLSEVNLSGANLSYACMFGSRLHGAQLSQAIMVGARLFKTDLTQADLTGAQLKKAHLMQADLSNANLYGADLSEADLTGANLTGANFKGANLIGANFWGANLTDACFIGAIANEGQTTIVKRHGPLTPETCENYGTNFNNSNITLAQRASLNL